MGTWAILGFLAGAVLLFLVVSARTSVATEAIAGWTGARAGVKYSVQNYGSWKREDGRLVEIVTIHVPSPDRVAHPLEVNARGGRPRVDDPSRQTEIDALLRLGAEYIDVGYNTDWIAADFMVDRVTVDHPLAEKVVDLLAALREKSR